MGIPTRRQPWCRARSLSQPTNRPSNRLEVVATKMDARVATLRTTTATRMIRAVMNAQARGVVLQRQLHRRRQRRREVATKMDARVATLRHYCDSESACTSECKGTWCGADSKETAALVQSKIPEPANESSGGYCHPDGKPHWHESGWCADTNDTCSNECKGT